MRSEASCARVSATVARTQSPTRSSRTSTARSGVRHVLDQAAWRASQAHRASARRLTC
jgi:hypothetical protein